MTFLQPQSVEVYCGDIWWENKYETPIRATTEMALYQCSLSFRLGYRRTVVLRIHIALDFVEFSFGILSFTQFPNSLKTIWKF